MPNRVVIGSQWGDEGKAKVVDFLTLESDVIIRFQGGANAGHTVKVDDQEFIFHLIPSGIMHKDKICVIGNGVVLDPKQILREIAELAEKGITPDGRLYIADNAHVVLPWHIAIDKLKEIKAGKDAIGTTGRGIGPCYSDKVNRHGVRVGDLLDERELRPRIEAIAAFRNQEFELLYQAAPIDPEQVIADFLELGRQIKPFVCDLVELMYGLRKEKKRFIFEGAQGTILDVDHGTYPFVTSSNTVAGSACCGSGLGPTVIDQSVGVVKAYTTRVGNGPFPTELDNAIGENLRKIGGEYGATTGRSRRCGWFDAPVVRKAAVVNGLTHLAMTKLDVLDTFDEILVCTHYMIDGKPVQTMPSQLSRVGRCEPVYETLPGWNQDTTKCRSWDALPENAKKYLKRIEALVEVKIGMVSVGAKRDQSIGVDLRSRSEVFMGSVKTIELLKGVDLFSSLSNEQLETLARLAIPQTYEKDETIILEDDESVQALFLIADGEVKVYMTGLDKRETILTLLSKGDFFGEMSLIDGEPRSASVKAVSSSEVLIIRREHFIQQVRATPDLAMSLLVEMSKRLRKANRQIGSLAMLTVYGRIAGTILNLVEERGVRIHSESGKMVTVIRNRPTQKQLAEMSGTTRETVSRVLSQLQKKGTLSLAGKDLIILEEGDLKSSDDVKDEQEQELDDED